MNLRPGPDTEHTPQELIFSPSQVKPAVVTEIWGSGSDGLERAEGKPGTMEVLAFVLQVVATCV